MVETKLTTVKILKNVYSKFKRLSFESDITLQKLVNRAVDKYVEDEDFRNEIVPGLFTSPTLRKAGVLKDINLFNAPTVDIKVEEDDILIFPSKAMHGTQFNKSNKQRISISGDVVCIAKDSELLENMMPPLEKWDKL